MKRMIFLLACLPWFAFAEGTETLFGRTVRNGGFGGPLIKLGIVNHEPGTLVGARGGWLINSMFSIGGGGYGLANRIPADHPDSLSLSLGVGGLIIEVIAKPNRMMHATASVLIGAGGLNARNRRGHMDEESAESFFALEPEVALEINVTQYFRVCPGLGYRYLSGRAHILDSYWDASGPTGSLTLKFGSF